jgi:hypothetical protein
MPNYCLSILLGLTTTVVALLPLSAQAEPKTYLNVSGQEDFSFNPEGLALWESIGLSFVRANGPTPPPGYDFTYELLPPSLDPNVRSSFSTFSYDSETGEYIFLGGREEFIGSTVFNVDTNKLALPPELETGNVSVSFTPNGEAVIKDTISIGLPLTTIFVPPSITPIIDFESQTLIFDGVTVQPTQQFSDFLIAAGATKPITGVNIVEGRIVRNFVELSPTPVPEPEVASVIWIGVGAAFAVRKWRRAA